MHIEVGYDVSRVTLVVCNLQEAIGAGRYRRSAPWTLNLTAIRRTTRCTRGYGRAILRGILSFIAGTPDGLAQFSSAGH